MENFKNAPNGPVELSRASQLCEKFNSLKCAINSLEETIWTLTSSALDKIEKGEGSLKANETTSEKSLYDTLTYINITLETYIDRILKAKTRLDERLG